MPTSVLKSQKSSSDLNYPYVNDQKEKRRRIGTSILHLISHNFQKPNKDSTEFEKQSQCNKSSFHSLVRFQNTKNQD